MRLRLPSSSEAAIAARDWFLKLPAEFRQDLESAIQHVESRRGECDVYIEVGLDLPDGLRGLRNNQVDLLICFDRLVAHCEIKSHKQFDTVTLEKALTQLHAHKEIINAWTGLRDGVYPILLCPRATTATLEDLSRALVARAMHHIRVAGVRPETRRAQTPDAGHPLYLPSVIRQLADRPIGTGTARASLERVATTRGRSLLFFQSSIELRDYLSRVRRSPRPDLPMPWHIGALRDRERADARDVLAKHDVVEICGLPGCGKTSLIEDLIEQRLIESPGCDDVRVSLRRCRDASQVAGLILAATEGESPHAQNARQALDHLLAQERIVWFQQYDSMSVQGLREFIAAVREKRGHCAWIVESHAAVLPPHYRLELAPFSTQDLHRILERAPRGSAAALPEECIRTARGNARIALNRWMAETAELSTPSESLDWFVGGLSMEERAVASAVAPLMDVAPLGLSEAMLQRWAVRACPSLAPVAAVRATTSLIDKLRASQLAQVEDVRTAQLGPAADSAAGVDGVDDSRFVSSIDFELTQVPSISRTVTAQEAEAHLYDALPNAADDLLTVTLDLNLPNLAPFFRSTFRRTHLAEVLAWLERRHTIERLRDDGDQRYALRCLGALRGAFSADRPARPEVAEWLAEGRQDSEFAHYAAAIVEGVVFGLDRSLKHQEIAQWGTRARSEPDRDLRCELLVRLAAALSGTDCHDEAWDVLTEALQIPELGSGARSLALGYSLAALNRAKVDFAGIHPDDRMAILDGQSNELFALGLRIGNLRVCADAVFYSTRAHEHARAREASSEDAIDDLLAMLPALEFVERIGGTRRTQSLLTQASIHRHTARWSEMPLTRFLPHADNALYFCRRAARRSLPRGHVTYALNAGSYMLDICTKLFRFEPTATEQQVKVVVEHARNAVVEIAAVMHGTASGSFVDRDREVLRTIVEGFPYLQFVVGVADDNHATVRNIDFDSSFRSIAAATRGERRTAGQRAQKLASYLTSANRSFKFARRVDSRGFSRAITSVKRGSAPLVRDMDAFAGRTSNDKLRRELRVFRSFVDDAGGNSQQ